MKALEELLSNIDNYYVGKSQKDKIYSYIMAGGIFAFLSWALLFDYSESEFEAASKQRDTIEAQLKADKNYLRTFSTNEVDSLQRQTIALQDEFKKIKDDSDYIDYKINQLQPLIYNEAAWGNFLDSITTIAKSKKVNIDFIHNKFAEKSKDFGHVLNMEIGFTGSFKKSLAFINALEQTPLVVDIFDLNVKAANGKLVTTLKLAVWGISY